MNALTKPIHQCNYSIKAYHAAPGISSTNLKLLAESPLHLDNKALFRFESKCCDFGNVVHKLILEPDDFHKDYAVAPKCDMRTKQGKEDMEAFTKANEGKAIISQDDMDKATRMADNTRAIAGGLLDGGIMEQSFFVDDDGLTLKCRPDCLREDLSIALDVKTVSEISEYGIKKAVATYRYDWTAYWYLKVLGFAGLNISRYLFLFVESSSPHMVKIRELSNEQLLKAEQEIETMLQHYRQYRLTGKYTIFKELTGFGATHE